MNGTEKQVKWAEDIRAEVNTYWANLERKYREDWEDPEGADEVKAEFEAVMAITAQYQDSAAWWIDEGKRLTDRGSVKLVMHRVNTYPETLERYL